MGSVCESYQFEKLPSSRLFDYDIQYEKLLINSIGRVYFKELLLDCLYPEFLKLFKENINLFYSKPFLEGISYEYGLFDKPKNIKKALNIYKNAADFEYDYICMYRMHRIFLDDYEEFKLKKNGDLHRLYLYKCFAYLPYVIMKRKYDILNKIDVTKELNIIFNNFENHRYDKFDKFMDFLEIYHTEFNITLDDIQLIKYIIKDYFSSDNIKNNINNLNHLLNFTKGTKTYFEAQLKYSNFYLKYSGENCDKNKIKNIFDNLVKSDYYKACLDYGFFLRDEKNYDEAKGIFKLGSDNGQLFCLTRYFYLLYWATDFNQILNDYNIISYLLKLNCICISIYNLFKGSFIYTIYYLMKHSSFKEKIQNDFSKYAIEVLKINQNYFLIENGELNSFIFSESYYVGSIILFGLIHYYGIQNIMNPNKEKALIYFKKAHKLSKEKKNLYLEYLDRESYLYIYKCRKYLYKKNKVTLRKLNKTKEKLFRKYDEIKIDYLSNLELYNYYKLYKIDDYGDTKDKKILILKKGKNFTNQIDFRNIVYKEKCKIALEKEYSDNSTLIETKIYEKKEDFNINDIDLYFKTMENKQYKIRVPKNIQFIIAIHKLYSKYPELETKKIGTYLCNGNKVGLFNTIQENGLENNNIILIINKFN